MLDNEFDQYFRDRLLDHSSKVKINLWKQVHAHLLQRKVFHFWKWYFVGSAAAAVAVTGYLMVAKLNGPVHTRLAASGSITAPKAAATAPKNNATAPQAPQTAATAPKATADGNITIGATPDSTAATAATAAPPNPAETNRAEANPAEANRAKTSSAEAAKTNPAKAYAAATHETHPLHAVRHPAGRETANHTGRETSDPAGRETASPWQPSHALITQHQNQHPTRPLDHPQFAAPVKRARLSAPADIAANTPNPKKTHSLTLPAMPRYSGGRLHLDLYATPEYYTWKTLGPSYNMGFRGTVIFKDHWTLTTGLQYTRINISHPSAKDSIDGLRPGYMENYQIPVFIGYTVRNYRYSFSVNAGALISFFANSKFHSAFATLTANPNGASLYVGLDFAKHVTDHTSIFAAPYLKCWLPPGDMDLPPQLYSVGLSLGLRFSF